MGQCQGKLPLQRPTTSSYWTAHGCRPRLSSIRTSFCTVSDGSVDGSVDWSVDGSEERSVDGLVDWSVDSWVDWPVDSWVDWSVD